MLKDLEPHSSDTIQIKEASKVIDSIIQALSNQQINKLCDKYRDKTATNILLLNDQLKKHLQKTEAHIGLEKIEASILDTHALPKPARHSPTLLLETKNVKNENMHWENVQKDMSGSLLKSKTSGGSASTQKYSMASLLTKFGEPIQSTVKPITIKTASIASTSTVYSSPTPMDSVS